MFQGPHLLWCLPTSPSSDLSLAEDAAAGEGMVASEVSQAATANTASASSLASSAAASTKKVHDKCSTKEKTEGCSQNLGARCTTIFESR